MGKITGFHVRHDLLPSHTREMLTLLHAMPDGETLSALQHVAGTHGYNVRYRTDWNKPLQSLKELGIITEQAKRIMLTDTGQTIAKMVTYQPDMLADFIHFLYYTCYVLDNEKRFSWSYRLICEAMWQNAPCVINRDKLVNLVTAQAIESFSVTGISFSNNSVSGVLNWLGELKPACLFPEGTEFCFRRRDYCSPELFILALNHVFQIQCTYSTAYVPLSSDFRHQVCRICLVAPENFDEMLTQTEHSFACLHVRRERGERLTIKDFTWSILES
jgi:hypothetical protein